MKKHLLPGLLLALASPAVAQHQHTELIGRAGLGLFRFGGPGAARTSTVNYGADFEEGGYTNNPYGRQMGTGFGVGGRVQRVGQHQGLAALELSYDWLRCRTDITDVNYFDSASLTRYAARGSTRLATSHIGAFGGLGHRFDLKAINLDLLAGPEAALVVAASEKGSGTYNGSARWSTDRGRTEVEVDFRLRADLTAWYRRLGLTASYSQGFTNYRGRDDGPSQKIYSRTLRLGLAYRLH